MQEAQRAIQEMHGFQFDKAHKLNVYSIDELDRLAKVPEDYQAPERATFDEQVRRSASMAALRPPC